MEEKQEFRQSECYQMKKKAAGAQQFNYFKNITIVIVISQSCSSSGFIPGYICPSTANLTSAHYSFVHKEFWLLTRGCEWSPTATVGNCNF